MYNGWKNYYTWACNLHLNNTPGPYYDLRRICADALEEDPQHAQAIAADALRDYIEEGAPDIGGMYSDILGRALEEVDCYEIVSYVIEDLKKDAQQ